MFRQKKNFRHGKKNHYAHRKVFYVDTQLNAQCRNLFINNYTHQFIVRFPEDIKKGKYFYASECDNRWCECSQNVFLRSYNLMTQEDEKKLLSLSPSFKYTLKKFKNANFDTYSVLNIWNLYNLWLKHPECEFVIISGCSALLFNKSFYRLKNTKQKEILRFMHQNPHIPRNENLLCITRLMKAYQDGLNDKDFLQVYNDFKNYREIKDLKTRRYFYSQIKKYPTYYPSLQKFILQYNDYLKMAKKLNKDIKSNYWLFPSNLKSRHDKIMLQLQRLNAIEKMKKEEMEKKEKIKKEMKINAQNQKIKDYCKKNGISHQDYAEFKVLNSRLSASQRFSITPRSFKKALTYCRTHDLSNKNNVAILYQKTVEKFLQYKKEIDGYSIYIPQSVLDIQKQAEALHQCLITCDYPKQVIKHSCILVFIRKDEKPIATVQIKSDGTIGQFHLDQRLDNYYPSKDLEDIFKKWYQSADLKFCA